MRNPRRNLRVIAALVAVAALGAVALPSAIRPAAAQLMAAASVATATFNIENMTCALCPITVKRAMQAVEGVRSVAVDFDSKTATVEFDPAVTTPDTIAAASTSAGYPARPSG